MNNGPLSSGCISEALRNMACNSEPSIGFQTVTLGISNKKPKSNTPWWVGPSEPTNPALSTRKITGNSCKAISWITWSMARWRNVL